MEEWNETGWTRCGDEAEFCRQTETVRRGDGYVHELGVSSDVDVVLGLLWFASRCGMFRQVGMSVTVSESDTKLFRFNEGPIIVNDEAGRFPGLLQFYFERLGDSKLDNLVWSWMQAS